MYLNFFDDALNRAYLTDLRTGRNVGELTAGQASDGFTQAAAVAITPDARTALVAIEQLSETYEPLSARVEMWNAAPLARRATVDLPWPVWGLAVTPDGKRVVANGRFGYAVLDIASARLLGEVTPLGEMANPDLTSGAEVSPDGRWAALARNGEVVLVDVATGRVARRARVTEGEQVVQAIAWTADSSTIWAGTDAGWLNFIDAETLQARAPRRLLTGGWVVDLEPSRDGKIMASVGSDGDITLWDTSSSKPYGQPVTDDRPSAWLTFPEDGRTLRAFFGNKEMVDIAVQPQAWVAAACRAANRNLSPDESAVILPGQAPKPTCPDIS